MTSQLFNYFSALDSPVAVRETAGDFFFLAISSGCLIRVKNKQEKSEESIELPIRVGLKLLSLQRNRDPNTQRETTK